MPGLLDGDAELLADELEGRVDVCNHGDQPEQLALLKLPLAADEPAGRDELPDDRSRQSPTAPPT